RKHKTEAGNLKGKFAYISPEQYQGQPLDGRSDVFSLGVSMYEALTGRSLYDRASEYETVAAIVLDPDVPSLRKMNPRVPEELDAICQRALAKDRDARYRSADEMQAALLSFMASAGQTVRHTDLRRMLERLVPDLVAAEPVLDRRPETQASFRVASEKPPPRQRTASQEMEQLLLAAEADDETEELYGQRNRSGRWLAVVSAIVIVLSIAAIAWVVRSRRDDPAVPTPTPTEEPAPTPEPEPTEAPAEAPAGEEPTPTPGEADPAP
ncbi:MAG: serine/threonine-protein kinase, partial [Sandaracinaceae bacterium]